MAVILTFQKIAVETGSADQDGLLVLANGLLVAVLVRLSDAHAPDFVDAWFLEAGFGALSGSEHPVFPSLAAARHWMQSRLLATCHMTPDTALKRA